MFVSRWTARSTSKENERKGIRKKRTPEEEKEKLVKLYQLRVRYEFEPRYISPLDE